MTRLDKFDNKMSLIMETISWKNSDVSGKRFDFEENNKSIGTLTVLSELRSNAFFTTDNDRLQFSRVVLWDNKILIKRNGHLIGEIRNRLLGQTYMELKNGNKFRLSSNLIGKNLKWLGIKGEPIVEYKMATLNSMRIGFIKVSDLLNKDEKEIVLSAGLIAGRFNAYRLTFGVMLFGVLLYATSRIPG